LTNKRVCLVSNTLCYENMGALYQTKPF
jgi:hypothetical protein